MNFFDRLQRETETERAGLLAAPLIRRCLGDGQFSLDEYVAFLTEAFHHVSHTVPLLMAVGSRLPASKESFRNAVAEYIEEELGHQEWILNDIAACGADADAVRHGQPGAATELMVAYAYDTVMRRNPMGFFGLPNKAFSYLRSHGSLDQEHMRFFEKLMNSIDDPQDRDDIVHAARRFYRLYGDIFRAIGQVDDQRRAA
jgi:pyrroloquinoline quinone (PQQ) biosynthesis protein C